MLKISLFVTILFINLFFVSDFKAKIDFGNEKIYERLCEGDSVADKKFETYLGKLFDGLDSTNSLSYNVFRTASIGYFNMKKQNLLVNNNIITIIDYSKPSTDKRFYVIDLFSKKLLYHTYVAHGKKTGDNHAQYFSNDARTMKSSLGFYLTAETFYGKHGYSMALDGVDTLFNDNARKRGIIIHGAWYVSQDFGEKYGRMGKSWGCPALPMDESKEIIDTIKNGGCLFAYYNEKSYLDGSKYLNLSGAVQQYLKETEEP